MTLPQEFQALKQIAKRCWQTSEDKGWHKEKTEFERLTKIERSATPSPGNDLLQDALALAGDARSAGVPVMSKLMLICTEVAEAAEVFRNAKLFKSLTEVYCAFPDYGSKESPPMLVPYMDEVTPPAKPEGFGSELADIVIRVFDLAEDLGIDIAAEIQRKMRFNEQRAYRHGGKVA